MANKQTSTFTIHHDRCKPHEWTARDFVILGDYVRTGDLRCAAHLSRLGMQLVRSEMHEAKGGELQHIGFADPDSLNHFSEELSEIVEDDVQPVVPIYRGPTQYAVRYGVGDIDGSFDGWEHNIFDTEVEAGKFAAALKQEEGR